MENVSRAKSSIAYKDAKIIFKKAGYGLTEQVLDASKCGVPQKRKRFFCIGALNEEDGFLDTYLAANQSVLPLSIRTYCALLQTFPLSFDFGNNQMIAEQMIGNAVPVNLSNHVARSLLSFIKQDTQKQSIEFINWLQQEHHYTQLAAKDVISHLARCNRLLSFQNLTEKEYLESLEEKETFKKLTRSIRSQLKRAVKLYAEYEQGSHRK